MMGEVEAKKDRVTRHKFRHDRHMVSLLADHLVFSPKYKKVLLGEVAEAAEEIIRETCKSLDIEVDKNHGLKNPRCMGICPLKMVRW